MQVVWSDQVSSDWSSGPQCDHLQRTAVGLGRQHASSVGVGFSRRQRDTGVGGILFAAVLHANADGSAMVVLLRFRCGRASRLQQANLHHVHHRHHQAGRTLPASDHGWTRRVGL